MIQQRRKNRLLAGGLLLLCIVSVAFALAIVGTLICRDHSASVSTEEDGLLGSIAAGLTLLAVCTALGAFHARHLQRSLSRRISELMETVLHTSQEWLWAVDTHGNFTFSSRASTTLLGYNPSELIGNPSSMVIDLDELATARRAIAAALDGPDSGWSGVVVAFRHRNGAPIWMEVSGRARPARRGLRAGFEGTSRPVPTQTARMLLKKRLRERIDGTLHGRMILTAFQPIHELETGDIIGVEALARFPDDDGRSPDYWFNEAATVGLGGDLEFAALESALEAAAQLPSHVYLALNISPETCLDPRLPGILEQSELAVDRIVLELTERLAVDEYASLRAALSHLRQRGLRLAVDDAGSGYASMRHILQLRPEIIKLDRSIIAGIADDASHRALGAAMVEFARQIGAVIVAEGIETREELETVTELGMTAGQGYLLGRPSIQPKDWATWDASPATPHLLHPRR